MGFFGERFNSFPMQTYSFFCLAQEVAEAAEFSIMMSLLRLSFLPKSVDLGLLILRLYLGLAMLLLHGWDKLLSFSKNAPGFASPIPQLPPQAAYSLMVFAEAGCSLLLIFGFLTRFASLTLLINMTVALAVVHKFVLSGPGSGEMAFLYLGGYLVLFLTGPGKFSVDKQ